jgi:hypothetical protein
MLKISQKHPLFLFFPLVPLSIFSHGHPSFPAPLLQRFNKTRLLLLLAGTTKDGSTFDSSYSLSYIGEKTFGL